MTDLWFVCELCGREFDIRDELEEHLVYNHDALDMHITVHDPENVEPGGL